MRFGLISYIVATYEGNGNEDSYQKIMNTLLLAQGNV